MRISPISISTNQYSCKKVTNFEQSSSRNLSAPHIGNTNFKGIKGKVFGGTIGGSLAALVALATMTTPVGWIATATLAASELGGIIVGGKIGDKIEGEDSDI